MTAILHPESPPTTRRALLVGALGGIGVWATSFVGRVSPTRATDGQAVIQAADNSGSGSTLVRSSTTTAFQGLADATSGATYGVRGRNSSTDGAGVYGLAGATSGSSTGVLGITNSPNGASVWGDSTLGSASTSIGVRGDSDANYGVVGLSTSGIGVGGSSVASDQPGIAGRSNSNSTGVLGYSGSGGIPLPPAKAKTGVYGYASQDSGSKGVWGESAAGHGVHGSSTGGYAGYFAGKVYTSKFVEMTEISAPAAPGANKARLFLRVNGVGKTQLCVRFQSGGVQVIKTEP